MTRPELALFVQRLGVIRANIARMNVAPGDKTLRDLICTSLDLEIRRGLEMLDKSLEARP